jgi:holo-[acyl-carrier protein] synthase
MRIVGIGVDIVEIARLDGAIQRQGQSLLDRCFLPGEQAYCNQQHLPARAYAARFAAKEAVAKALGTGMGAQLEWLSVEVRRKATGEPFIVLLGVGAETARRLGVTELFLSLSHSEHYAVANVVAAGV